MIDLNTLLKNVPLNHFLNNNWNQKYLHIKGKEDDYEEILNWKKFNSILNNRDLSPHLRYFYNGTPILPQSLNNGRRTRNGTPQIDMNEALKFNEAGATTIIQHFQTMDSGMENLVLELSKYFPEAININAYYSSSNIQGFDLHTDPHETFVLQIEGKKKWILLNEPTILPLKSQLLKTSKGVDPTNKKTITLEKGDFLYLPRGVWHKALALEPSLHLTISLKCKINYDFVKNFTEGLIKKKYFRENLRSYSDPSLLDRDKVIEILDELKKEIEIYQNSEGLDFDFENNYKTNPYPQKFNFPY